MFGTRKEKRSSFLVKIFLAMSQSLQLIDSLIHRLENNRKYNFLFLTKYLQVVQPYYEYVLSLGHSASLIATNTKKELGEKLKHHIFTACNTNYDAIIMHSTIIDSTIIDQLYSTKKLKIISLMSSGYDHIDINHCKKLGIRVTNISPSMSESVADYIVGLMLSVCRGLFVANKAQWKINRSEFTWKYRDLHGKNVGIIGLGNIGKALSKRLYFGFNCNVYYFNHNGQKEYDELVGAKYAQSIDKVLKISDFVVPLCPLTKDTEYMFNIDRFKKMKNDAWFINVGRGKLCDTKAIIYALKNELIAGAALDCTDPEPLDENTMKELGQFDNCVVMPHIGSFTRECKLRNAEMAVYNALKVLSNQPCSNIVC